MVAMTLQNVAQATGGAILTGEPGLALAGISTDTRTLLSGQLFLALKGDTYDAHAFLADVAGKSAGAAVIHDAAAASRAHDLPLVLVEDTTRALGDLANWHRSQCPTTVIGITGSNGKTTTKEMLFHILDGVVRSIRSISNFNNLIGVPLTLFQMRPEDIYAVVEMGTNSPGEIARLAEIADPDIGLLTNVGESHLEGLGDLEGVAREKAALLRHTGRRTAAFYNADDYESRRVAKALKGEVRSFGIENDADLRAFNVRSDRSGISFKIKGGPRIQLPIQGAHNASNALAAITVARKLGIDWDTIAAQLVTFKLPAMRMETTTAAGVVVINDAYNANPVSLAAAAKTLSRMECTGRKVLVVADMLELGERTEELHRELGKTIAGFNFDYVLGRGRHTAALLAAAAEHGMSEDDVRLTDSNDQLARTLLGFIGSGDTVLLKGSRNMHLEEVARMLSDGLNSARKTEHTTTARSPQRPAREPDKSAGRIPEDAPAALSREQVVG
jgi:UDP-N-acetylmuramoyl-tripeptide--D-alanyl-D-alanine ligase